MVSIPLNFIYKSYTGRSRLLVSIPSKMSSDCEIYGLLNHFNYEMRRELTMKCVQIVSYRPYG